VGCIRKPFIQAYLSSLLLAGQVDILNGLQGYSSTKMFFAAQISFRIFGHTVTLTSPR
jgi:hypothetical protein